MDSPKSSQQSSLDSLRTVEFRQTLRGYHIDDVDEYLERVAVEADALQEQLRQANERVRQAAERIAQLEKSVEDARGRVQPAPAVAEREQAVSDDTLQRTLVLAQQFVDQTKSEAEASARAAVAKAEEQARVLLADAETRARSATADTERKLREEVGRLEEQRTKLNEDVQKMSQHLEGERSRLRSTLAEMLTWIDKNIQPVSSPANGPQDQEGAQQPRYQGTGNGPQGQPMGADKNRNPAQAPTHSGGLH